MNITCNGNHAKFRYPCDVLYQYAISIPYNVFSNTGSVNKKHICTTDLPDMWLYYPNMLQIGTNNFLQWQKVTLCFCKRFCIREITMHAARGSCKPLLLIGGWSNSTIRFITLVSYTHFENLSCVRKRAVEMYDIWFAISTCCQPLGDSA